MNLPFLSGLLLDLWGLSGDEPTKLIPHTSAALVDAIPKTTYDRSPDPLPTCSGESMHNPSKLIPVHRAGVQANSNKIDVVLNLSKKQGQEPVHIP